MKNIVVCDSGLGGLDVAAHFFRGAREVDGTSPSWNVHFVNARPAETWGYNDLPTARAQEEQFQQALEQMAAYAPERCLLACNTLSIVWERLSRRYAPPYPVVGITDVATAMMTSYLSGHPDAQALILGTKITVESGYYRNRLLAQGIDPSRIHSLACPKFATLIEQDPSSPAVSEWIRGYASQAASRLPSSCHGHLALAFCCTHYGYATPIWQEQFSNAFGQVAVLNPNDGMIVPGVGAAFTYHECAPLDSGPRLALAKWFDKQAPIMADGLRK